ncbi:MAG: GNAT family N-acetyltransferase [Bacteroidetes bacterium]|nr:GNAT family N-acetyltransferase [Bacteroidota bacterium]
MIRPATTHDRSAVTEIVKATGNFSDDEIAIANELIDIFLTQPEQRDYFAYVFDENGRAAGFLIVGPTPATTGTYDMYWIAVHPDFHGRGIAQALDRFAEDFVKERGGYWLIAETSGQPSYERTRGFYQKQGYRTISRIADYYKPGDDLIVFGKRLDGGKYER